MPTEDDIKNALRAVKYPGYSRDVVSFGLVKHIAVSNGAVSVVMNLTGGSPEVAREIKPHSEAALRPVPGVKGVLVEVNQASGAAAGGKRVGNVPQESKVPGSGRVGVVASGKGGASKSTVSVNLACALQHLGT